MSHLVTTFLTCKGLTQKHGEYVLDRVSRYFAAANLAAWIYAELVPEKGPPSMDVLLHLRDEDDDVVWASAAELVLIQHPAIEIATMVEPGEPFQPGTYALDLLIDNEIHHTRLLYLE